MDLKNPIKQDIFELNSLYSDIVSVFGSFSRMDEEKKDLSKKIELITNGIEQDKNIISLLKESNNRISEELEAAGKEYGNIKGSMKSVGELVRKLEKMDSMQTELAGLKRINTSMRLKVTPLSAKIWKLQEELFDLGKEKKQVLKAHSEIMKKSREFLSLRTKILPKNERLDLKDRLTEETVRLEKNSKESARLKEELARLVPNRDNLKLELETTMERLSSIQAHIDSFKGKIQKISPRVMPEEEVKKLDEDVNVLKEKKALLTEEKKKISPQIASIAEEDEEISTILESYKLKCKKDSGKLAALKEEMKGIEINRDTIEKLREKASTIDGELEDKRRELESIKKEYSEVLNANQKYKATIEEVEKGTKKLRRMIQKKKK